MEEILKTVPGAQRAARGIIIPVDGGGFFHVAGVFTKEETEGLNGDELLFLAFCAKREILRLRELRNAHDYLLRLRAMAIVDDPRACRVFRQRRDGARDWSLTKYYHSRENAKKAYLEHVSRHIGKSLRQIPAGLGYTRLVNAHCFRSLIGDVVLVSEALESFLYFMNLAFHEDRWERKRGDREAALIIAIRIMLGSESLDFDLDSRGDIPRDLERGLRQRTEDQLAFVFGHEYSHHACGHLSSADSTGHNLRGSSGGDAGASAEKVALYSHRLEHEADLTALLNVSSDLSYQKRLTDAAFTALFYFDFLQPYLKLFSSNLNGLTDSHPTAIARIVFLRNNLKSKLGPSSGQIDEALESLKSYHRAIESVLATRGPQLFQFYGSIYIPSFKDKVGIDRFDF